MGACPVPQYLQVSFLLFTLGASWTCFSIFHLIISKSFASVKVQNGLLVVIAVRVQAAVLPSLWCNSGSSSVVE